MSELIVILVVALLVLPPSKWPMLLFHLAKLIRWVNQTKANLLEICKTQIQQYELEQHEQRAQKADQEYHQTSSN